MTTEIHGYTVDLLEELGRGAFGTVYKGRSPSNETVAVKKISKANRRIASTETAKFLALKLRPQNHQIVQVIDIKSRKDDMWIFMEYCDLGDLDDFFRRNKQVVNNLDTKIKLMKQIMNGIVFLHSEDIVHRDIKPANILLKQGLKGVLVKLGDFGLSKFLDPEGETSGMSSHVGTPIFQAPEFFEVGNRTHYHRNIDVYAAGLTFAALLQANKGKTLRPQAEGSLQRSEINLPIGFAAFQRMVNKHPDIAVIEIKRIDAGKVKKIKEIIQGMTKVSPQQRLNSSEVEKMLKKLLPMTANLRSKFKLRRAFVPNSTAMTFVNDKLVVRGKTFGRGGKVRMNLYDPEAGRLLNDITCKCSHWLDQSSLAPLIHDNTNFVMEGCPECRAITVLDMDENELDHTLSDVYQSVLCAGTEGTIFVWGNKKIKQYRINGNGNLQLIKSLKEVHHTERFSGPLEESVDSMCYDQNSDTIVFLSECEDDDDEQTDIWGIKWNSGRVVWHHCRRIGEERLDPRDVCSTPQGWVIVANGDNLLLLDPADGSLIDVIYIDHLQNISQVACRPHSENIQIAILHGEGNPTKITSHILECSGDEFGINLDL